MGKSLHTNCSEKQNSKFPQSAFKIYNHYTVFGYMYNLLMTGKLEMGDAYKI